jgi:hypothetical protein
VLIDFDQGKTFGVLALFSPVYVFSAEGAGEDPPVTGPGVILPHSRARRVASILNGE